MRISWLSGISLGASALIAIFMLLLNFLFQVAGGVPDLPGCAFLAGNLVLLAALYPAISAAVTVRVIAASGARLAYAPRAAARFGERTAATAALFYFGVSVGIMASGPARKDITPTLALLLLLYVLLCAIGGRLGGHLAAKRAGWVPSAEGNA